ncbi:MAG: hypothetical protein L6246_09475 [Thermodesulfovibrionales bacterium]|nr:hypothetical protein [Nitrospinota bacterium]MCG2710525.1 hypothetical protein [Thermodesulfovibrionales bacterium]
MESQKENSLKKKIIEEMTVDYSNALEKNFDLAKQFIRITKDGKVDVLSKDKLNGKEQLLLYLIGKLYAKEAGFAATDDVGNNELLNELGIPSGSLLPWLKGLREENKIKQIKKGKYTHHSISVNWIEKTLKHIEKKMKKYI